MPGKWYGVNSEQPGNVSSRVPEHSPAANPPFSIWDILYCFGKSHNHIGGLSWPPRPERMEVPPLAVGPEVHRGGYGSDGRF